VRGVSRPAARAGGSGHAPIVQAEHTLDDVHQIARQVDRSLAPPIGLRRRLVAAQVYREGAAHLLGRPRDVNHAAGNAGPHDVQAAGARKGGHALEVGRVCAVAGGEVLTREGSAPARRQLWRVRAASHADTHRQDFCRVRRAHQARAWSRTPLAPCESAIVGKYSSQGILPSYSALILRQARRARSVGRRRGQFVAS
jgi:hypothetical protein